MCVCVVQGRLTQTLPGGRVEEVTVLAARPAVAAVQSGQQGAGDAVGLGGAVARLAGRVARWGKGGRRERMSTMGENVCRATARPLHSTALHCTPEPHSLSSSQFESIYGDQFGPEQ